MNDRYDGIRLQKDVYQQQCILKLESLEILQGFE